jgi:3-oxoacyl-[acyl-carrier protein] reductase
MNSYDFEGRVAIVTGGANGIGAEVVSRLVSSGARVAIWDLTPSDCEPKIKALSRTNDSLGAVDVLINSAGIAGPSSTVADYPVEQWQRVQRINLDGTFHCCKLLVPSMVARNYGRIVNIASIAGKEGNPNAAAYSASKAAVIGLTKSLGKELAAHDIAVNCITPATAQTRILEQVSEEFIEYMRSKIPRGRFVTVEEIASMVLWIASAENSFTTAAVFDLSGGRATY